MHPAPRLGIDDPSRMKASPKVVAAAFSLMPAVMVSAWVLYRSFWVPENHIGFDSAQSPWAVVPSILPGCLGPRGLRALAWVISILTAGLITAALHFNLLLQYDDWVRLGMPDKPTWATQWPR